MTSKFVEIVPPSHQQGNCIPFAAIRWHDFGNRPALGRPFGHYFAIQTHPSCRFHLAVDFLGLRRSGFSTRLIYPPQDFPKQVPGHSDFRHLERGLATTASSAGIANFRIWLQADLQPPEIDFRSSPSFGHSGAQAGLPLLTRFGSQRPPHRTPTLERSLQSLYRRSDNVSGRGAAVQYLSHSAFLQVKGEFTPSHPGTEHLVAQNQ